MMERTARVQVNYFYDEETHCWNYEVPGLRIVGGGVETRRQAEEQAIESIAFTLSGDEDVDSGDEVGYVEVTVMGPRQDAAVHESENRVGSSS